MPAKHQNGCRVIHAYPTGPFTILEPQHQEIGEFCEVKERRATYFEAQKLWKGRSGTNKVH